MLCSAVLDLAMLPSSWEEAPEDAGRGAQQLAGTAAVEQVRPAGKSAAAQGSETVRRERQGWLTLALPGGGESDCGGSSELARVRLSVKQPSATKMRVCVVQAEGLPAEEADDADADTDADGPGILATLAQTDTLFEIGASHARF